MQNESFWSVKRVLLQAKRGTFEEQKGSFYFTKIQKMNIIAVFFVAFLLHVTIIQSLERIIKAEISAYCYLCNVKRRQTYMSCKASDL